jgi:NDP-sugar pyrophosphorylase family protein
MDIRGLVLVNSDSGATTGLLRQTGQLSLVDVAGKSSLARMIDRLKLSGIQPVTVLVEENAARGFAPLQLPKDVNRLNISPESFWRVGENIFNQMSQTGAELVVVVHVGPYVEIEFDLLVQFHLEKRCRVSQVVHIEQPLEIFSISASRRNDAASLFRSQLMRCRSNCPPFIQTCYLNRLADMRDLRQLAIDILTLKTATQAAGEQVKPGVWVAPRAQIERDARILAPAFVGSSARIGSGSVITRCTTVERRAHVDCGTVVENSTVLPYSYVGAGLDLSHSVAGMGQIANLRRDSTVEINDQQLIGHVSFRREQGWLPAAAGFLSSFPERIRRRLSAAREPVNAPSLSPQPGLALIPSHHRQEGAYPLPGREHKSAGDLPSSLAVARRYGDQ